MHLGIFTPTEASAVAVFYALVGPAPLPHARFRRAAGDPVSHRDPHRLYPHDHRSLRSVLLHPDDRPIPRPWRVDGQLPPARSRFSCSSTYSCLIAGIFIEPLPGVMIFVPIPPARARCRHPPLHFRMVVIVNLTSA